MDEAVSAIGTPQEEPDGPGAPGVPDGRETPEAPDTPDVPDAPDAPDGPEAADAPDGPGVPDAPEASDGPDAPDAPDEESGRVDRLSTEVGVLELEALLFVAERPLSRREIGALCGLDNLAVDELLGDLEVALRGRGIRLVSSGERVEAATAPEAGGLIARYLGTDGVRLSPAALETLAIIAYRQPATRGTIERIRGVDSDYVVRSLLHRRLIVEQGRADTPGRPIRYGTGFEFMERFGLTSLDDLPPLDAEVAARLIEDEPATAAEDEPGIAADNAPDD